MEVVMAQVPTPGEAARMVADVERIGTAVRTADAWRYVAWLVGMAVATVMYLTGLGVSGTDEPLILATSGVFVLCVAALSVGLLPGSRVTTAGLGRRWASALVGWAVLFAAVMVLGLLVWRGELAFWIPGGILAALPLVLGARAELRTGDRP